MSRKGGTGGGGLGRIFERARECLTLSYLQQVTGGKKYTPCNVTRLRMEEVG